MYSDNATYFTFQVYQGKKAFKGQAANQISKAFYYLGSRLSNRDRGQQI